MPAQTFAPESARTRILRAGRATRAKPAGTPPPTRPGPKPPGRTEPDERHRRGAVVNVGPVIGPKGSFTPRERRDDPRARRASEMLGPGRVPARDRAAGRTTRVVGGEDGRQRRPARLILIGRVGRASLERQNHRAPRAALPQSRRRRRLSARWDPRWRSAATAALMTARTWVAGAPRAWARARATARATTYQRGSRRLAGP